jgi:DNA replication protein DnaC
MDGIRKVAMNFVEHFGEEETKNMFFLGKPGTGKTFLSGCIANDLINRGKSVLYLSSPELYEKITEYRVLSNAFSPDPERFEMSSETYHSILQCDLFILDDLGTETIHANRQPELLNILNHRLNMNKKIIISTNLDTASLSSLYDERVLSRIFGNFSVLRFFGEDLRHTVRGKNRSEN